jgi:hypothetical protein
VSDSKSEPAEPEQQVVFTKEPQPDLPRAERLKKAGFNKTRIVLWIAGAALALWMIGTGVVGILTKAR